MAGNFIAIKDDWETNNYNGVLKPLIKDSMGSLIPPRHETWLGILYGWECYMNKGYFRVKK